MRDITFFAYDLNHHVSLFPLHEYVLEYHGSVVLLHNNSLEAQLRLAFKRKNILYERKHALLMQPNIHFSTALCTHL